LPVLRHSLKNAAHRRAAFLLQGTAKFGWTGAVFLQQSECFWWQPESHCLWQTGPESGDDDEELKDGKTEGLIWVTF